MRRRIVFLLLFLFSFALFNAPLYSQQDSTKLKYPYFWLNIGVGGSQIGMAGVYSLSYEHKSNLFTVRYLGSLELHAALFLMPPKEAEEFAVLYNVFKERGSTSLKSLSLGIGKIRNVKRGEEINPNGFLGPIYEHIETSTVGLAVDFFASHQFINFLGLGVYGFANINKDRSLYGLTVCLQMGRLR